MSHFLFSLILAALMYIWHPHENVQKYAYSEHVDLDGELDNLGGGGPDHPDDLEEEGFKAPEASVIGAVEDELTL